MRYIEELREGDMLSEIYLCKKKDVLKTKAGKTYYSLILQDKTGTIDAKIWEISGAIEHFEVMDFVKVDGQVTVFQGSNQLNVRRVMKMQEGEYILDDYMPCSEYDIKEMWQQLMDLLNSVKEPHLKELIKMYFVENKEFIEEFKKHSAAKAVHHGFVGGLLEHTLHVTQLCDTYTKMYKELNRDLLITAAAFHDMGKVQELSVFPENDYTDDGQLLGHIMIGAMEMQKASNEITGFPHRLQNELVHCILAHHGEMEYGSPKKPALMEAIALHHADNTDAKLETFKEAVKGADDNTWLGYNRLFESNIRRTSKQK